MNPSTSSTTLSIAEAIALSFQEFERRFGADLLWDALKLLTLDHEAVAARHQQLGPYVPKYLIHPLHSEGASLAEWMAAAHADPEQAELLLHVGVRWWRARDDMLRQPPGARIRCDHSEAQHVRQYLLRLMLQFGRSPNTVPDQPPRTPPKRGSRASGA